MSTKNRLSILSSALLAVAAVLLAVSIFVPIWRIDLDAPQYPEGLRLLIFADKLGGNVDIINGLNHYIGMKTLHAEEFVEFTVLPYIIGAFAVFALAAAVSRRKKMLYALFAAFVLFGVVAMADFWRWEYNYGHNLDPNAAIIVPGMAYQPPLIGFKQLLNFGAYSVPALGGWLFVGSGVLMLLCLIAERRKKLAVGAPAAAMALFMLTGSGCAGREPEAIRLNTDACDYCKMTISDIRFACELITKKGRIYKFDDAACMRDFMKEDEKMRESACYVADFLSPTNFIEAESAHFVESEKIASPMGGNMAAFSDRLTAENRAEQTGGKLRSWKSIVQ